MKERIAKGIEYLDHRFPDWHYRVNVDSLCMGHDCYCVLAQLQGGFEIAQAKLEMSDREAYEMGFLPWLQWRLEYLVNWPGIVTLATMGYTKAWRKAILEKRKQDKLRYMNAEKTPCSVLV